MASPAASSGPDLVICAAGRGVQALSRRDGRTVWRAELPLEHANLGYPRLFVDGDRVVVVSGQDPRSAWTADVAPLVTCLDNRTGQVRWKLDLPVVGNAGRVAALNAMIADGQLVVAFATTVVAVDLARGAVTWSAEVETGLGDRWLEVTSMALAVPGHAQQADRM